MIYCIWYPSGGFGHFVNAVISLHGDNFVRPKNKLEFSDNGDSHLLDLTAPKYFHDNKYNFTFDDNVNYSVLIDNGINNEGVKFLENFPSAKVIKMCYTDNTWPVIAKTMIDKLNADHTKGQIAPDFFTHETKCMSCYDSIVVFERGNVGAKIPQEYGGPKSDEVLVIRTH